MLSKKSFKAFPISNGMNVLMLSTDRKIFEEASDVRARMVDYAGLFEKLEIVVFAKKSEGFDVVQIAPNCHAHPTNSLSPFSYILGGIRVGQKILKGQNYGNWVITCQDPFEAGLAGWWLARKFRVKLNLQIHTDVFSPFFGAESLKNKIRVAIAKFVLPKADSVRVVSERIKKTLAKFKLKTEPIVLPIISELNKSSGGSQVDLHQKYPQFDFIILMASRLTREKNFPLALKAIASVAKLNSRAGLIIVGNGPERKKIEEGIARFGLQKNVILEKWNDNLSAYYQTADLFLLTSNYEGYGRTLIEAAQFGCPILSTDTGAVGELFNEQNSLVCPVGDQACLEKKLSYAIENREKIKLLAEKALADVMNNLVISKEDYLERYRNSL
ncbi:MAG TPA: glycosyltransferase family 4 protein [Candidatus Paceibacterota bacterium]|nr:glycosyltransferase family 4 protein [Candidatus Paceibacterota bacterium]